jgi:hypothetical protein
LEPPPDRASRSRLHLSGVRTRREGKSGTPPNMELPASLRHRRYLGKSGPPALLFAVEHKFSVVLLLLLILAASFTVLHETRAFVPYPSTYVTRLRWLNGWPSRGYYGFNCSGFLSNAHNERYFSERELNASAYGNLLLIDETADLNHVDESRLQPRRYRRLPRPHDASVPRAGDARSSIPGSGHLD